MFWQEAKVIQIGMDNSEKQLNSEVNRLYGSLQGILKGEPNRCMKEIQETIDLDTETIRQR